MDQFGRAGVDHVRRGFGDHIVGLRKPARHRGPLDDQRPLAGLAEIGPRDQAVVAAAHDHDVVTIGHGHSSMK
ncbi:hypothetical protein D3C86_1345530 [compost metagenome]